MHEVDNELDRRDFLKRGAQATAAAAATVLGTSAAQGAVPDDKKIAFTDALPTRKLGKTEVELPMLGYGGAAAAKKFGNPLSTEDSLRWFRFFVSSVGHNYFTFNDPYFRIILLRAVAWTMNELFDPFKSLATARLER